MYNHRWSGWPGAFCLKCGAEDPLEIAIGDNEYDPFTDEFVSEEVKERVIERNQCSISDDERSKWIT